jgi:hypothetical protein
MHPLVPDVYDVALKAYSTSNTHNPSLQRAITAVLDRLVGLGYIPARLPELTATEDRLRALTRIDWVPGKHAVPQMQAKMDELARRVVQLEDEAAARTLRVKNLECAMDWARDNALFVFKEEVLAGPIADEYSEALDKAKVSVKHTLNGKSVADAVIEAVAEALLLPPVEEPHV